MNGSLGLFSIKPDQMQLLNPALILLLIPLFDMVIYPAFAKYAHNWMIIDEARAHFQTRICLGSTYSRGSCRGSLLEEHWQELPLSTLDSLN